MVMMRAGRLAEEVLQRGIDRVAGRAPGRSPRKMSSVKRFVLVPAEYGDGFLLPYAGDLLLDDTRIQRGAHSLLHLRSGEPRSPAAASGPALPAR